MNTHIFGIRHHGPGSARSLRQALAELRPEAILIEGPPEAEELLPFVLHPKMQPPVALLIYNPEQPKQAAYYPFAAFSPEWQALYYGLMHKAEMRFMDLPLTHQFAQWPEQEAEPTEAEPTETELDDIVEELTTSQALQRDPLGELAKAAGYGDGESWWEHVVEERRSSDSVFGAINEAMTTLRETLPPLSDGRELEREAQREAFMRQTIRRAQSDGFTRIAVVCGAWHAPALDLSRPETPSAKDDTARLKNLPKVKLKATWIPWTNGRLSYASGYGAGINSPGWYQHLWEQPERTALHWLGKVARLLRGEDLDASPASVIEAVRLAETIAALRDRPQPGLAELNEAALTVLCFGNELPLRLIHDKLIVGEVLGAVPNETPQTPLQQDLQREQKRLRLAAEAAHRDLDLDLRKENDLQRSYLLHRLLLLGIAWGGLQQNGAGKSTFHERWRLQWQPEFAVELIEASVWGNTVRQAATGFAQAEADKRAELPALIALLDHALLADLPEAVDRLLARLQAQAALSSDIANLMSAVPPLANVLRYGNVRQTDAAQAGKVLNGLVTRICIGLPGACAALNEEAAAAMYQHLVNVNGALGLLQNEEQLATWRGVLLELADQQGRHGLVAGRCCRMLLDARVLAAEEAARRLSLALSTANDPAQAAAWIEGLLKGSGLLLLHDEALWCVLDEWVMALPGEAFQQTVPLLRRTFATFAAPERRQMGERVKRGTVQTMVVSANGEFDAARAEAVLPLVKQLLGL